MENAMLKWLLILALINILKANNTLNNSLSEFENEESSKVLSRTKRYLIFPDGSSFQLVFCTQTMGYLMLDIIWFGNTAALAWELPTDPSIYSFFKQDLKKFAQKRQDVKHIVYFDENGKILSTVPYRRKIIVNPAFAKRSIDAQESTMVKSMSVKEMHEKHRNKTFIQELDTASKEFHREGRKSLYSKLEVFFQGLGLKGKECVLRLLCEHARQKDHQGTFIEEIMRATFTFPRSHESNLILDYDVAHSAANDCAQLYSECEGGFLFEKR